MDFPVSWLNDSDEPKKAYSPQMHAALAVYFQQLVTGQKVDTRRLSEVAGISYNGLRKEIKEVKKRISDLLETL